MSTAPIDSGGSGGGVNRMISNFTVSYRNNSVGISQDQTRPSSAGPITTDENTWIHKFNRLDRVFSGGLLHIFYRIIDITILLIGLASTCDVSNHLSITSICLLIFYFLDLTIILILFLRNVCTRYADLTEEEKLERLRRASTLRGFFIFFKLIPICVGTAYTFSSSFSPSITDCQKLMRFCLGIVCFSTWLLILIPLAKPELPARRSLVIECFILFFVLVINSTYIGTIANAMTNVQNSSCIYSTSQDFYLGAPLKSYAYFGLILFGCTTGIHIINLVISQLCFRLNRIRRFYVYYYALQYSLNYFATIIVIYYFSVGALFLFQPQSGQPCRADAPYLYQVLLIWEWIRILSPLIAIPLLIILCCLGVFFGIILSYCLPASITVPILESLRVRIILD